MLRIGLVSGLVVSLALAGWLAISSTTAAANGNASPEQKQADADNSKKPREFPDSYYFYPNRNREMEGKEAPALQVKNWIGEPQELAKLKGKVVVVDFWATWCGPCVASLPHNVHLVDQHKGKDLVFIGVHDGKRGSEKMAALAKDKGINYPLAVDDGSKSEKAYKVAWWPTYVVLDRKGTIRAYGLNPSSVEKVVKKLLDEKS